MTSGPRNRQAPEADERVARLIARAGPRPVPAVSIEASVRGEVEREWRAVGSARRRTRQRVLLTAAAAVATLVGLGWFWQQQRAPTEMVATLVASRGPVHIESAPRGALIAVGDTLVSGTSVRSGRGAAVALSIASVAVRLGPETTVELGAPGEIRLASGRLYIDSGPAGTRAAALRVDTPFGSVTHLGTQFQVQVIAGQSLSVTVREGLVRVQALDRVQTLPRGEGVEVARGGTFRLLTVTPYDNAWSWVSDLVPDFSIEGQPLSTFLDWFARETGRTLVFVPPATRAGAARTTLNGTISGLTPVEALEAVLATTRFRYDVAVPGQVRIGLRTTVDDRLRTNAESTALPAGPPR